NHREVTRHLEPPPVCNRHNGSRHVIVAGEDGCWSRLEGQEFFGGIEPRAIAEETLLDAVRLGPEGGFPQRCLEPEQTLATGRLIRMALDETDVTVTQSQQIARHLMRGFEVINADARRVRSESARSRRR